MNILVMGAGAIGSVFGGLLAEAGHRVFLVGREPHMSAIARDGLFIGGIWGEHHVRGILTYTSVSDVLPESFDLALITTKTYDTEAAVSQVKPLLSDGTTVVSLQNGIGNYEIIASQVGAERAVVCRVIFGVDIVRPGRVEVTVQGGEVMVGEPTGSVPYALIEEIARVFDEAGISSRPTRQIMGYVWGKVLYNCALNPLSAIFEVPYGHLLRTEETRGVLTSIVQEGFAVAERSGVQMLWSGPDEYRRVLFEELIPPTAAHYASMYADIRRGKRTEIDAMNGAIARMGREMGISCPANEFLTALIKAKEQLAR